MTPEFSLKFNLLRYDSQEMLLNHLFAMLYLILNVFSDNACFPTLSTLAI